MARSRSLSAARGSPSGTARVLAAAGLIALLGGIAAIVLSSDGESGPQPQAAPVSPTPSSTTPDPSPARPTSVRIAVTGAGAYDPDGDGSENDGDAVLATDGNGATAWKSERYRTTFAKTGVGLVVDAGRSVKATRVVVATETPGYKAQVRVGSSPKGPFVSSSETKIMTKRTTMALRPRTARYLMLWITSMPEKGAAAVNEITVRVAG